MPAGWGRELQLLPFRIAAPAQPRRPLAWVPGLVQLGAAGGQQAASLTESLQPAQSGAETLLVALTSTSQEVSPPTQVTALFVCEIQLPPRTAMQFMGFLPLWVGDIPDLGHVIRAEEPQASSGAILDVGTSRGVLQGSPVVSTCSSYTESSKAGSAANRQTLGTKGQRAARGQGAELLMSTAAALPAKTSSLPLRAAVLYSVCAGCCSSHSSAHIRANLACVPPCWGTAVGHQRDTGFLGTSELQPSNACTKA